MATGNSDFSPMSKKVHPYKAYHARSFRSDRGTFYQPTIIEDPEPDYNSDYKEKPQLIGTFHKRGESASETTTEDPAPDYYDVINEAANHAETFQNKNGVSEQADMDDPAPDYHDINDKKENKDPSTKPPQDGVKQTTSSGLKQNSEPWDVFRIMERDGKRRDVHMHTSFQIIKLCMYIFLFIMVLTSLVVQKISLVIATSKLRSESNYHVGNVTSTNAEGGNIDQQISQSDVHSFLLLVAICTPYLLTFISSFWKVCFGNVDRPSVPSVIMCTAVEVSHSIGLCLLVFQLLPNLGLTRGACVLSATTIIPSFLKMFYTTDTSFVQRNCGTRKRIGLFVVNMLAFFLQLSVLPFLLLPDIQYLHGCETSTVVVNVGHDTVNVSEQWQIDTEKGCKIVLSLFLTSVLWWENFIDKVNGTGRIKQFLLKTKYEIEESRSYIYIFVSVLKIVTSVVAKHLAVGDSFAIYRLEFWDALSDQSVTEFTDILCLIGSAFIGYYVAYIACKLQMQIFSFSLPCLLSTPFSAILMTMYCQNDSDVLSTVFNVENDFECNAAIYNPWYHVTMASLWLLSIYWVAQHIWFPRQERIAKVKRLQTPTEDTENKTESSKTPPFIYACATMWHETRLEMLQLLKSLFRLDEDQFLREKENEISNDDGFSNDYYRFEAHIMFDDAFKDGKVNEYVETFASVMNEAASSVHSQPILLEKPIIIPTSYGGQVVYRMPGENLLFIHLKDRNRIRHKKRWSQVMYLYYLLGYRLTTEIQNEIDTKSGDKKGTTNINESFKNKADNTFLLALDGDVDFTPGSVRLLIDRMKKDQRVGAACGRIHPIGSGPIVWYQKFEYAVAHWLQKATEHVLGCVLCSPGCFSLFRGSALMDDNVMKKYTLLPLEASQILMYDLGEDRWLCTLLLQQGYRVDYAAGADAYTYAPEGFNEYFNQRKRWGPSTLANIMALLQDGKSTVEANSNISRLYIMYQGSLMVSTIIGPATILMMIAGAFVSVFSLTLTKSYIASLVPAIVYFIICVTCRTKIQLAFAQVLSGVYVIIMMVVLVGVIITAVTESPYHPSVIFVMGLVAMFIIAALLHPREWSNIMYGMLYYVLVPSGFLVLVIYSLCNLNDVSWGTRENATTTGTTKQKKGLLSNIFSHITSFKESLSAPNASEKENLDKILATTGFRDEQQNNSKSENTSGEKGVGDGIADWVSQGPFVGRRHEMGEKESRFWKTFVDRYLKPLERDEEKEKRVREQLRDLRNNVCGGMALINLVWIAVNFMFQLRSPTVVTIQLPKNSGDDEEEAYYVMKLELLGLLFIGFFLIIMLIQFCGMIMHRWGTFLHLVAITEIPNPFRKRIKKDLDIDILETYRNAKDESEPTTEIPEEERQEEENEILKQIKNLQDRGTRYPSERLSEETPPSNSEQKSADDRPIDTREMYQHYRQNTVQRMKRNDTRLRYRKNDRNGYTKTRSFFKEANNSNQHLLSNRSGSTDKLISYSRNGNEERSVNRRGGVRVSGGLMRRTLTKAVIRNYNEYSRMN